jgi:hypothetical protein
VVEVCTSRRPMRSLGAELRGLVKTGRSLGSAPSEGSAFLALSFPMAVFVCLSACAEKCETGKTLADGCPILATLLWWSLMCVCS